MNNPSYVFILASGFTTNFIYTIISLSKAKSDEAFSGTPSKTFYHNSFLAILSGIMWYGQFFFYGMGTTKMGEFDFASWSIHMASIIIFSNLWGLWLKEWQLVSRNVVKYLLAGIVLLIISVVLIGIGNYQAS
jgi:L-rhamnose-H+ transport protein